MPRRERLDYLVRRQQPQVQEERAAEQYDPPYFIGRRRARAHRNDPSRRERLKILGSEGCINDHEDRSRPVAGPRELERHRPRDQEAAGNSHADGDHSSRQVIQPGSPMDAGILSGERPQKRWCEHVRVDVEVIQELARRGQFQDKGLEPVRRHCPENRIQHVERRKRGHEEEKGPEQPGPPVTTSGKRQQNSCRRIRDQQSGQIEGEIAMLAVVVVPYPGEQRQRRRHLDNGDGDDHRKDASYEYTGVRIGAGQRRADRRVSRGVTGREGPRQYAQVVENAAAGGRGEPRAALPLHVLIQRDGVRRVDDYVVRLRVTHPASRRSGGPARAAPPCAPRPHSACVRRRRAAGSCIRARRGRRAAFCRGRSGA